MDNRSAPLPSRLKSEGEDYLVFRDFVHFRELVAKIILTQLAYRTFNTPLTSYLGDIRMAGVKNVAVLRG